MATPKIAVIGAGGIGGFLADALGRNGHDVLLCVRTPIRSLRIRQGGAIREVPARIATDASAVSPVDWVVLATKGQDTAGAAPWLRSLVGPATKVAVAQNGIDHADRVRPFVGDAEILPVLVYAAVERIEAGLLEQHSGNRVVLPMGECGAAFASLLKGSALAVEQIDDFHTAVWRKLLSNAAVNPITALTMRRMDVMHDPDVRRLALALLQEAVAAGRAAGARLDEHEAEAILALHDTYDVRGGTSMLYDRLAGRPLEHEYLAGAIVHYADIHGVPVPLNRAILTLLRALA
jgi:2-dehydropantoate 2-reductase